MAMEIQTALIAAVALIFGTSISVVSSLLAARSTRKTAAEDREASLDLVKIQWQQTQDAERNRWLREEKQRLYLALTREMNASKDASEKVLVGILEKDDETPTNFHLQVKQYLNEMLLMAPKAKSEANEAFKALSGIVAFGYTYAGVGLHAPLPAELDDEWQRLRAAFNYAMGRFLSVAHADLGAAEG